MDQLVVLQEIFESYMRGGFSRPIDPKSISGDCADLVAALLERFEDGQIDEGICVRLLNCLSDIYDIKRLGDICRLAGHLGVAARCYNKSLSLTTDPHVRSVLLNNLGQVHARQGYLGRALHYYERAKEGFSALGDIGSLAQVLGNMGSAYRTSQEYDKAIDSCRKSLEIFESLEDEFGVAQMTGSLGRVYAETGDFDLALQQYEKSLAAFEGLGDQRQVGWLLNRIGRVNAELARWESAIGYYQKSMGIFEGIGQDHNAGVVLSNLGRLYLEMGDLRQAADDLETSLDLIRKSMQPVRANAVSWLAAARSIQGRDLHHQALRQIAGEKEDQEAADLLVEASVSYRGAAECYIELAMTERVGLPNLETEAAIARFASAFVMMEMETEAERAVKLAEEGVGALNSALSKGEEGSERPTVEALRRCMMGMKEAWRLNLIKDEDWKLNDVVSDAVEHFNQGILQIGPVTRGSREACGHLLPAFKTLGRFISAKLKGESAGDLSETIAYLKRAERAFELAAPDLGMISAFQIREARLMVERLQEISGGGGGAKDAPLLKAGQSALLLMGRVLTRTALAEAAELDLVRSWNESMNLIEERPLAKPKSRASVEGVREIVPAEEEAEPPGDRDFVQEYEKFRERRRAARSPMIRSIEEVLLSDGKATGGEAEMPAEPVVYPGFDRWGVDGRKAARKAETEAWLSDDTPDTSRPGTTVTVSASSGVGGDSCGISMPSKGPGAGLPAPSPDGPPAGRICEDIPAVRVRTRSAQRRLLKFFSDLGEITSRRSEFKTARLERWSSESVLKFVVWRSLRLFAALVLLYLLIDLTHYLI
ncbi:MAG: Tetratricopeptide TPR_2 repeat protein [Methanothrix sp.]|jgi:tetratricopeptide (TPR) repeat protein|nr:MAG: Tetratricopeptide TPR_2 repeat protein [Methanothrix sp.]